MEKRQEALNYVAKELARQALRQQVTAAQQTLEFLKGIEDAGDDEDLQTKIRVADRELKVISTATYLTALENKYAEVYNELSDKHLCRFADELEYEEELVRVGALNGPKVDALVEEFLDGTYKAPTIQ